MIRKQLYFGNTVRALNFVEIMDKIDASMKVVTDTMKLDAHSFLCILSLDPTQTYTLEMKAEPEKLEKISHLLADYVS